MDKRASSVYAKRPRFAVFGIGDYSFSSAKVAISGLHKNTRFRAIGSSDGKPIMVDDTCYFIPCTSKPEADLFAGLLNSKVAQRFMSSLVFEDSKRPVTVDVLRRIDLRKLAETAGKGSVAIEYLSESQEAGQQRLFVFEQGVGYQARESTV